VRRASKSRPEAGPGQLRARSGDDGPRGTGLDATSATTIMDSWYPTINTVARRASQVRNLGQRTDLL
jgi:hypothetical protein